MFEDKIACLPQETQQLFINVQQFIRQVTNNLAQERLWGGMPTFSMGDKWMRIIPLHDHINIEADAVCAHLHQLTSYSITPKGMSQIFTGQPIPMDLLTVIIKQTLGE
ncbi:MAG: DUF1801 domain-containing protein [Clostridia bacterium]|nr:DUF1801 domain-containing protein [Clostridia bacterium]